MALSGQLRCMKYLANFCQFYVRVSGHVHIRVLSVSVSVPMSVSVSMSFSVSMSVSISMSVSVLFQFKYGAMNIYGRQGNYIFDFQGSYEVARKLKGPLI